MKGLRRKYIVCIAASACPLGIDLTYEGIATLSALPHLLALLLGIDLTYEGIATNCF